MSDQIMIKCPRCGVTLRAGIEAFGKTIKCPTCGTGISVLRPAAEASSARQAPAPSAPTVDAHAGYGPLPSFPSAVDHPTDMSAPAAAAAPAAPVAPDDTGSSASTGLFMELITGGALFGAVITVAFYALLLMTPLRDSYWGILLTQRGWVPYAIMYLTFWGGVSLKNKYSALRLQRAALQYDYLPEAACAQAAGGNPRPLLDHLSALWGRCPVSYLARRAQVAANYICAHGASGNLSEYLQERSSLDKDQMEGSYTMTRVFIWAIPVLGFVGTVIGISDAIASFSNMPQNTGKIEIAAVQKALAGVTAGLAVAFDTTLVGLVMSLILMFIVSAVQKMEEGIVAATDLYCASELAPRLSVVFKVSPDGARMNEWIGALKRSLTSHETRLSDEMAGRLTAGLKQVGEIHQKQAQDLSQVFAKIEQRESDALNRFDAGLRDLGTRLDHLHADFVPLLEKNQEQIIRLRQILENSESLARLEHALVEKLPMIQPTHDFVASQELLCKQLGQLTDALREWRAREESRNGSMPGAPPRGPLASIFGWLRRKQ
ncbi:MAG: MotA/TolQ/ExbB proton channel family protein [Candidatus Sumerlaeota bacterium]|nr:MotA/TolQ/ExbB proton channel family protein [Candidatus Sumerlaeota bacterium]